MAHNPRCACFSVLTMATLFRSALSVVSFKPAGRYRFEYKQMLIESKAERRNADDGMLLPVRPLPMVCRSVPNTRATPVQSSGFSVLSLAWVVSKNCGGFQMPVTVGGGGNLAAPPFWCLG